ncbi:MAG: Holliday junction branch migration protein RuvA [Mycoplasmatales bacterium]
MYDYLIGKVTVITSSTITLEVNNVGYLLLVANPYSFEGTTKIFVYNHVREDENSLFGFKTLSERELFLNLIAVNGIGPKTALAIIAQQDIDGIKQAIVSEDVVYLQKFPKVGKKTAQQIIIDLSGKYKQTDVNPLANDNSKEVIEALVALGYKETEIKKHISKIDQSFTIEQQIKQVLMLLFK